MRVLITGDRKWIDNRIIVIMLLGFKEMYGQITVIEGCADGADKIACKLERMGIDHKHFPAHWRHFKNHPRVPDCPPDCREVVGRPAGPIRNRKMLAAEPDVVLAYHDDLLGTSKGTKDMVKIAKSKGKPVYLVSHP